MATKMDLMVVLGDRVRSLTKSQHERLAEGERLSANEEAELREEVFRMTVAREHETPGLPAWVSQGMNSRGWMLIRQPIEAETIALKEVQPDPDPEPEAEEYPEESEPAKIKGKAGGKAKAKAKSRESD